MVDKTEKAKRIGRAISQKILMREADRKDEEEQRTVPSTPDSLVEDSLAPDYRHIAALLTTSAIRNPRHRIASIFLGREDYDCVGSTMGKLRIYVMLECLKRYVSERKRSNPET